MDEPSRISKTGWSFYGPTVSSPSVLGVGPWSGEPSTSLGGVSTSLSLVIVDSISDYFSFSILRTPYCDGSVSPSSASLFLCFNASVFPKSIVLISEPSWYISPSMPSYAPSSSCNFLLTIFKNVGANLLANFDLYMGSWSKPVILTLPSPSIRMLWGFIAPWAIPLSWRYLIP